MQRPLPGCLFQYGHRAFVPIWQLITTHEVQQLLSNVFKVSSWLSEKSSPLQMVCQNTIGELQQQKIFPRWILSKKDTSVYIYIHVRINDMFHINHKHQQKWSKVCFLFSWQVYSVFKQRHGQVLRLQKVITKPEFRAHTISTGNVLQILNLSSVENETWPSSSCSAKRNKTIKVEQFCRSQNWLKGPQFRGV